MKDIFFTKGPREPKKNAKNYWALPLHILLSLNTHLRWFFPLFRTNKCNFFRLWKLKWRWWFWWGSTITYSIWDCEHCNVHKRFVFCKSRRAISCSLQIKMCNYCKVQATGTAFLKDDVWLKIQHVAGSYTVDIHFGAWSYTVVIHNWISNGYPSWSWMKAVSTIPLQLTPWSGYLVVKWWGAENHGGSWIIDLNNSPLQHPNKSFSVPIW